MEALARIAFEVYPPHVIERHLGVSVGRLLAYHFVDVCTEHAKEGKLTQRAEQYLAQYDRPIDNNKAKGSHDSESDSEAENTALDHDDHGIVTSAMKSAVGFLGGGSKKDDE